MADLFRPENCSITDAGTINCTYVDNLVDEWTKDFENDPGVIFATELYKAAQIQMVKFVFVMMALAFTVMIFYVETRFGGLFGRKKKGGSP